MHIYIFLSLPLKSQRIHKYFCLKINCFNLGISEIFLWLFFTSPSSMLIFFIIVIIFIAPNAQLKFPFLEELPYLAGTSKDVWCWAVSLVRCKTFDLIDLHDQEVTLCCMHPNPITRITNKSIGMWNALKAVWFTCTTCSLQNYFRSLCDKLTSVFYMCLNRNPLLEPAICVLCYSKWQFSGNPPPSC